MKTNLSTNTINSEIKSNSEYNLQESETKNILPKLPSSSNTFINLFSKKIISAICCCLVLVFFLVLVWYGHFTSGSVTVNNNSTIPLQKLVLEVDRKKDLLKHIQCNSSQCYSASNFIIRHLDQTADPCNDFYEFACGEWVQQDTQEIKEVDQFTLASDNFLNDLSKVLEEPLENHDSNIVKNLKTFYKSCSDDLDIESYSDTHFYKFLYKEIGEWPILGLKNDRSLNEKTDESEANFLTTTRFGIEIFLAKLTILEMPLVFRFMSDLSKDNRILMRINTPADFCDFQNLLPQTAHESKEFFILMKQLRDYFYGNKKKMF